MKIKMITFLIVIFSLFNQTNTYADDGSRYSFKKIKHVPEFLVNFLKAEYKKTINFQKKSFENLKKKKN